MKYISSFAILIASLIVISCTQANETIDVPTASQYTEQLSQKNEQIVSQELESCLNNSIPEEARFAEYVPCDYFNTPAFYKSTYINFDNTIRDTVKNLMFDSIDKSMIKNVIDGYRVSGDGYAVDYKNYSRFSINFLSEYDTDNHGLIHYLITGKQIDDFSKDIIKKILTIAQEDKPEIFLEQLLNSKKITEYYGCIVQQKRAKKGMIEISFCEEDNIIMFSLYKPNP